MNDDYNAKKSISTHTYADKCVKTDFILHRIIQGRIFFTGRGVFK